MTGLPTRSEISLPCPTDKALSSVTEREGCFYDIIDGIGGVLAPRRIHEYEDR
jgi:hypothetical protein